MCDTLVALGNSTTDGSVLFAKNSDRQPNEPHIMIHIPGMRHDLDKEKQLQTTTIKIPQVEETYEVVLLKPSWIWGCEMGWNEHGLNIGNEAVFTKEENEHTGLIGMDFIRIALERCKTSLEAVNLMTALLDTYGQGGNCGFEKPFYYHNSFLIADRREAWVLETAGHYWVAKQIRDTYCISNGLTIGNDFDMNHPEVVSHAIEKGWCNNEREFSFSECYGDKLFTRVAASKIRREACQTALSRNKGKVDITLMKSILRHHHKELGGKPFRKKSIKSVCMHGGGRIGDHTTGSYVASLSEHQCTYLVTGASTPCIAVFKPLWMEGMMPIFKENEQDEAIKYWKKRERLHRLVLQGCVDLVTYREEHARLEQEIDSKIKDACHPSDHQASLDKIMEDCYDQENRFMDEWLGKSGDKTPRIKGIPYYRRYWKGQNAKLS